MAKTKKLKPLMSEGQTWSEPDASGAQTVVSPKTKEQKTTEKIRESAAKYPSFDELMAAKKSRAAKEKAAEEARKRGLSEGEQKKELAAKKKKPEITQAEMDKKAAKLAKIMRSKKDK